MHTDGHKPVISIIVPVHNESEKTIRCFTSIRTYTPIPHEIIWVDNGSSSAHVDPIKRQATQPGMHTKLIKLNSNVGFVKATNIGLKNIEDSCSYVILLNNDTEVTEEWAEKLIAPLMQDPAVGAVGPITQSEIAWQEATSLNRRWRLNLPCFSRNRLDRIGSTSIRNYGISLAAKFRSKYVNVGDLSLSFFCAAMRKTTVDQVGLLDEDFGYGLGDDDEYCYRLRTNGFKQLLSLGTFVYHRHRTTFTALRLPIDQIRRTNMQTLRRKTQQK